MFSKLILPAKPPSNIGEAVRDLNQLLEAVGLAGFSIETKESPQGKESLTGAVLHASIPLPSLEKVLKEAASQAASEHGVNLSQTALMMRQADENKLVVEIGLEAKVFGGGVQIKITGFVEIREQRHLQVSGLRMDGGAGMFAGMAGALIKPRLKQWEGTTLDLQRVTGVAVKVTELSSDGNDLSFSLTFE